jgi:hypothetical protein
MYPRATDQKETQEAPHGEPRTFAGYEVHDPLGRKIGTAEEVFANQDNEPEYVGVKIGFFGPRYVLLPVQFVAADSQRRVLELR